MRPKVFINFAMSLDGKLALGTEEQTKISNELDFKRVHELRNSVDAILVGIGTVLKDDPSLIVKEKYVEKPKNPIRIVLDSKLRIPENAKVLDNRAKTIIFTTTEKKRNLNAEIKICGKDTVDIKCVLEELYKMGVRSILVEGGSKIIGSFLKLGFVDKMTIFIAPIFIGPDAPSAANFKTAMNYDEIIKMKIESIKMLGEGILVELIPDVTSHN